MVDGLVSGLESCAPFALVWNRFQPPCVGGSFFCRRVATLPQSESCRSTLKPIFCKRSTVTRLSL